PPRPPRPRGAPGQDLRAAPPPGPRLLRIQGVPAEAVQALRRKARRLEGRRGADVRMTVSEPFLRDLWDRLAGGGVSGKADLQRVKSELVPRRRIPGRPAGPAR